MSHQADERIKRVWVQEQGLPFGAVHLFINKDHRGRRIERLGVVFRVVDKGDVARLHLVDFIEACDRELRVANKFGTNKFRYGF